MSNEKLKPCPCCGGYAQLADSVDCEVFCRRCGLRTSLHDMGSMAIAVWNRREPRKHRYFGAGESDCPREIKAPNGELHTLRCKVCGEDNPRDAACAG